MTNKEQTDMVKVVSSLSWKFNDPQIQQDLFQVGAVAWLESVNKGDGREAVEAWEAMNDFMSKSKIAVTVPMHEGTRTALKRIRSGHSWNEGDCLDRKSYESLATVLGGMGMVADEMPRASSKKSETTVYFQQLENLVSRKFGEQYVQLFVLHYGEMGYTLQEVANELDLGLSLVKKMNSQLKAFLRAKS